MRGLSLVKVLLGIGYVAVLFAVQDTVLRDWTVGVLLQAVILNSAIIIGIYAFRGFETRTAFSVNSSFIATAAGGLTGALVALIPILFFIERRIGRFAYIWTLVLVVLVFPFVTHMVMRLVVKRRPPRRFFVVGDCSDISAVLDELVDKSLDKIEIIGCTSEPDRIEKALNNSTGELVELLVVDQDTMRPIREQAEQAHTKGVTIQFLPEIVEENLSRIPLEVVKRFSDYYSVVFSYSRYSQSLRILDILISTIAIIVLSPLIFFSALYILLKDGRPIIYSQTRHGLNGKQFRLYKFRTMTEIKGQEDPVMTKSGKLLRALRFNELPQFFNVIKGDMSIVGPRPDIPSTYEFCTHELPFYHYRTKIMPGLTGHAQVLFLHVDELDKEAFAERLSYDLYYVKNYTISLYLSTILKTLETVVFGRGRAG